MNKAKAHATWTQATENIQVALTSLIECVNAGYNGWLEVRNNQDPSVAFPITIENPALQNPFNWTGSFGTLRASIKKDFLSDTHQEMFDNWIECFGTAEAIKAYQERGEITKDLILCGNLASPSPAIAHPVRITDANKHREMFIKDGYKYNCWATVFKPKAGIPYNVPAIIPEVFVVCYDDTPLCQTSKTEAIQKAIDFLSDYKRMVEKREKDATEIESNAKTSLSDIDSDFDPEVQEYLNKHAKEEPELEEDEREEENDYTK